MKKITLLLVGIISTSLLFSQESNMQKIENTVIENFVENYNNDIEQIITEEFKNIVITPTIQSIEDNVEKKLKDNPIDLVESQNITAELDKTLLDISIKKLLESSAPNLAKELQKIIEETIADSIQESLDYHYKIDKTEKEDPKEVENKNSEEIILESKTEETTEIKNTEEISKTESTEITTSLPEIENETNVPVIEEPSIKTTSSAPEKINYTATTIATKNTEPAISQTIQMNVGDYKDIILNGEGWIFLGELKEPAKPVVTFYNRYMDGVDSYFGFDAINAGTTTLHFYKQDIIGRTYLDEYVKVIVKQKQIVRNNSYVNKQEEAAGISAEPTVNLAGGNSAIVINNTSTSSDYVFIPETILDEAENAYNEQNFEDSIALLDEYTSMGKDAVDRALYLYAKNYESNATVRNVKLAHSYYKKIVNTFPDSQYYDESKKRILYLERFYLVIR